MRGVDAVLRIAHAADRDEGSNVLHVWMLRRACMIDRMRKTTSSTCFLLEGVVWRTVFMLYSCMKELAS
jgi:hypothetical protein